MNWRANHDQFQELELVTTFSSNDRIFARDSFSPHSKFQANIGTLAPELISKDTFCFEMVIFCLLIFICFPIVVGLIEAEIISELKGIRGDFFSKYSSIILLYSCYIIPTVLFIKKFCDIRYLLFQGDQVIFQSRQYGRRVYATEDLQFHYLRLLYTGERYQLEVELPDESLPEDRRMLILEAAVGRKTMDGILAVLFPLIQGDDGPYRSAKKRHFQSGEDKIWNIMAHLHVWFLNYKINQILLWIVHGSTKKIFKKEAAMRGG